MSEKRIFANITDATSMMLKHMGFRSRRLRDFICSLQGVAGARHEFDCTHIHLARRLDHNGKQEAAETFVTRYLNALEKEQQRVGRKLFNIERGGGIERKPTHYVDCITACAIWAVEQARASELWKEKQHSRAIAAFVPAAVEMLPTVEEVEAGMQTDAYVVSDGVRLARNRKHIITRACANFEIITDNHGDVVAHAEALAAELLERAHLIAQRLSETAAEREGDQFCTPSTSDGDQNCTPTEGDQFCTPSPDVPPDMRGEAVAYVAYDDLPVFPVRQDKTPLTPNGFKDATRDESIVLHWWRKHKDAGIGIPTGKASGLLVIDIDPRHGGDASLTELLEQHGPLPETWEARTGGGGHHIIFAYPQDVEIRNSAGKLGEGIDVRGEGGYIVVAPSLHASGRRYEWLNGHKPAPVPDWLLARLTAAQSKPAGAAAPTLPQDKHGAGIGAIITEGNRNNALHKIASAERGRGESEDTILQILIDVNARRCAPPLEDCELEKIARSVMRYQPNAAAVGV